VADDDRGRTIGVRHDLCEGRADREGDLAVQLFGHQATNVVGLDEL
jgi:hypothetical protein